MNPYVDIPLATAVTSPVIVALDFHDEAAVLGFVSRLDPRTCRLKVGKELFTATGPKLVETLVARGFEVFLDLKFHDIPNTVASACKVAAEIIRRPPLAWTSTIHTPSSAAREALESYSQRPLLIAVTVLTSLDASDLAELGIADAASQASMLAKLAAEAGADGVVCSAHEAARLKAERGADFALVTPGIRLDHAPADDQRRVMTPTAALAAGSHYLVIGRPITQAADPHAVLTRILADIGVRA